MGVLAVKLGIAVLSFFRIIGTWLLGRKNRKIGHFEERLDQVKAEQEVDDAVRNVAETPVSDDDALKRLRDGSA